MAQISATLFEKGSTPKSIKDMNIRYSVPLILMVIFVSASAIHASMTKWKTTIAQTTESTIAAIDEIDLPQGCLGLDFDGDMDHLLSKYKQVYIIAPAKAAGSTYNHFARECMATAQTNILIENDILTKEQMEYDFRKQLELPSLVASHAWTPYDVCRLVKHSTKDSLIVFSHREETERLMSAIKFVLTKRICFGEKEDDNIPGFVTTLHGNDCWIEEAELIKMIRSRYREFSLQALTCDAYDCIRENRPNLVFMNYKQANKLQKLISKHHCPNFKEEVKKNVGAEKQSVMVVLEGNPVPLDDWIKAKKELLEVVFRMKTDVSCQGTTREIEDALFACPNETLLLSGQSVTRDHFHFECKTKEPFVHGTLHSLCDSRIALLLAAALVRHE